MRYEPWDKEVLPEPLLDQLTMDCTCGTHSCLACNGLLEVTLRQAIRWNMITKEQALAKVENYKKKSPPPSRGRGLG
jgi:hypothetical protein